MGSKEKAEFEAHLASMPEDIRETMRGLLLDPDDPLYKEKANPKEQERAKQDSFKMLMDMIHPNRERVKQKYGDEHQVITRIDGKTIQPRCVQGFLNFYLAK